MSIIKKLRECAPYHAHNILFNQPGLGSAGLLENFAAAWKSNAVAWKSNAAAWKNSAAAWKNSAAASRFMMLAAISLSLTLAGCDTGGGGGGDSSGNGGGGPPTCTGSEILKNDQCEACPAQQKPNADKTACISADTPTCTGNQALQNNQCVACTDPQYPNADRTACVTSCDDGELKPDNKPTCETMVTCTGDMIHNPSDNTCIENTCLANELVNTTVTPNGCITKSKCRGDNGKVVSTNEQSCIRESACTSVANQFANAEGECKACSGNTPVVNHEQDGCTSIADCQSLSENRYSVLNESRCITDADCMDIAGHVATADGDCEQCAGDDPIRNMEKTACMSESDCQSQSDNRFSVLDGADCITDAACVAEDGRVATTDGDCQTCTGTDSIRNMEKTACMSAADCQDFSSGEFSVLDEAECITDAACQAMPSHVATADGNCMECTGNTSVVNLAGEQCVSSCESGEALNLAGEQCVSSCESGEALNLAGEQCVSSCGAGEVVNLLGLQCIASCPASSSESMGRCLCTGETLISPDGNSCRACGADETQSMAGDQCLPHCHSDLFTTAGVGFYGMGTQAAPYVICDYAGLLKVKDNLNAHYELRADIDANASCLRLRACPISVTAPR